MATWSYAVAIDSAAVDIVGTIIVRTEESTAGSAEFSYAAPPGQAFNPADLRGKPVAVSHNSNVIFTGKVEAATPTGDGLIRVRATDGLLEYFDGLTEQQILNTIPGGRYHPAFFGQRTSGWAQAQAVLETVPLEVHMDPAGTLQINSWFNGVSRTFTDAVYLSEGAEFANERNRVNAVDITVRYRFARLKERRVALSWVLPWYSDLPAWRANPTTLPSRDMIQAAADGTGWGVLGGIEYITLPNDISGWTPPAAQQERDVIYAELSLFHRWTQPIEETYTLQIREPGGASTPGIVREVAHERQFNAASWENQILGYDPGFQIDNLGDYYKDEADRDDLDDLMRCAIAWGQTRIAESARDNYVQFALVTDSTLTLADVVSVNTPWVTAEGKVYAMEHRLDTSQGGADITVITLAVDPGTAGGSTGGEPPEPPLAVPDWQKGALPGMAQTHIGSIATAPVDNPDWVGYVGNYDPSRGGTGEQIYDGRFRIGAYEIEQQSLDPFQVEADPVGYTSQVPGGQLSYIPNPVIPQ